MLKGQSATATDLEFLTTDHLGTPVLTTDGSGVEKWGGGFEPFGEDFSGADEAGQFLRFPGQWVDGSWGEGGGGGGPLFHVHRWYQPSAGRYGRPDPLGYEGSLLNWYVYAEASPLVFLDLLGLTSFRGFPPGKREEIERAVDEARETLEDRLLRRKRGATDPEAA